MMKDHNDFQRQFKSVMENLLHSAVSETTKLFENAVQEMKAELAWIRQESDNLKYHTCSDENPIPKWKRNPCERDVGVQCDVMPTQLEKSCGPLQQGENNEDSFSSYSSGLLQDGNQPFALLFIKQEEADPHDYTSTCLFPKVAEEEPKPFLVEPLEMSVTSEEDGLLPGRPSPYQSLSKKTRSPFTHSPMAYPQYVQEPALSTPVETQESHEFNPLDSLQTSLDLMPDIKEEKSTVPLQPPSDAQTDAADGSISAIAIVEVTPKREQADCDLDEQNLGSLQKSQHDQTRRTSTRPSTSKYRRMVGLETPQLNAENIQQSNYSSTSTCDITTKALNKMGKKRNRSGRNHGHQNHPGHKNQCEVCGRILCSATSLKHHQSVHRGERPFDCDRCGKAFHDAKGLRRHLLIHTVGKRHQCTECGKMFVHFFHLTAHQFTHTGEKPFRCKVCGKYFTTKSTRNTHMKLHAGEQPFSCTLCSRKFRQRTSLNTHLQRHKGERPYVCLTCNKGFWDPNNLKAHKRVHSGERPYQCKMCNKSFKQSAHLKKHFRTHGNMTGQYTKD